MFNKEPEYFSLIMKFILKIRNNPEKIKLLLSNLGLKKGMKILDYGCGLGHFSIEASKITGESGKVISADVLGSMIKALENNIEIHGIKNISTKLINDAEDINDHDFDCIFLIDVLQFISNKIKFVNRLISILSDNGMLIIRFRFIGKKEINNIISSCHASKKVLKHKRYWCLYK